MPFSNRVRLPIELTRPQYPTEKNSYRLANGGTKTQSVVIRKVYIGATDWLPEGTHEKIQIALSHDHVYIEGEKYIGEITADAGYDINWQDTGSYPTAPAKFKAEVTPFNATNSNCMTCEEAIQVVAVDDDLGTRTQGVTIVYDVSANDSICCYPFVFSVRYYDTSVVQSATINSAGVLTLTLKTPLQSYTHLKLATYRVECGGLQYDEADVYANITGTIQSCLAPTDATALFVTSGGALLTWTPPSGYSGNYHYQLFNQNNLGSPVHEGDVGGIAQIQFNDLVPGNQYVFYVASKCDAVNFSNQITTTFSTMAVDPGPGNPGICGRYQVGYTDPSAGNGYFMAVTYTGCDGVDHYASLINGTLIYICALEYYPGNYVKIIISAPIQQQTIQYAGTC
ncbi:MAG: fibronectin type III domain-containing protein [Taibaiella sp.]|nr:fibronectin type III domain-containing protein [Taibaiella sp.]